MARPQDLKIQKALTAELKKQREILAAHNNAKEKLKRLQQLRKKDIYCDSSFNYNIRTRQNCNIVYEDDSFRIEQDEGKKEKVYEMMRFFSKEMLIDSKICLHTIDSDNNTHLKAMKVLSS